MFETNSTRYAPPGESALSASCRHLGQKPLSMPRSRQKQRGQPHSASCVTAQSGLGTDTSIARPPGRITRPISRATAHTSRSDVSWLIAAIVYARSNDSSATPTSLRTSPTQNEPRAWRRA